MAPIDRIANSPSSGSTTNNNDDVSTTTTILILTYLFVTLTLTIGGAIWLTCSCCGRESSEYDDEYPNDCADCEARGDFCDNCLRNMNDDQRRRRGGRTKRRRRSRQRGGHRRLGGGGRHRGSPRKGGGSPQHQGGGSPQRHHNRSPQAFVGGGGLGPKFDLARTPGDGGPKMALDDNGGDGRVRGFEPTYQTLHGLKSGVFESQTKGEFSKDAQKKSTAASMIKAQPKKQEAFNKKSLAGGPRTDNSRAVISNAYHLLQ